MSAIMTALFVASNLSSLGIPSFEWPGVTEVVKYGHGLLKKAEDFIGGKDQVKDEMSEISSAINDLERSIKQSQAAIIHEIDSLISYHQVMHDLTTHSVYIDNLHDRFQLYSKDDTFEKSTVINFAETCTSHDSDQLPSVINYLYRLVEPTALNAVGLFDVLTQGRASPEEQARACSENRSIQQDIYLLYMIVAVYIVKGFTMRLYAYQILKSFDQGEFTTEKAVTKAEYETIMTDISQAAFKAMSSASRIIRPCDAKHPKDGETFTQLKWLFGTMITNEIFLNPEGSCEWKCPHFENVQFYPKNFEHTLGRCNGRVYNCSKVEFDSVCETTDPNRRYNGFVGKTQPILGTAVSSAGITKECIVKPIVPEDEKIPHEWTHKCRDCVCTCDDYDYKETVRTFSLRPVESDVANNKVITGVRFVGKNRVFYLQIQQGQLGANGTVDISTLNWVEVDEIDYKNPTTPSNYYYTVTVDRNGVNLDTLTIPNGRALTGIRFNTEGSNLKLEVRGSPINYVAGNVEKTADDWISAHASNRVEVTMIEPNIPTLAPGENIVDTHENGFIKFRQTDLAKDIAQTAVPFLDIQPVVTNPPVLLSGAGIYYKGVPGYGGFLGLQLVTYDYREHIETNPSLGG